MRLLALAALLMVCVVRWDGMLIFEAPRGRGAAFAAAAALAAVALTFTARSRDGRLRIGAALLAGVGLLAGGLLAAGVPLWMFDPRDWDELASGLGEGISALPGVTVPYRGVNEWVRIVIACGGTMLAMVAVLAATWPRSGGRAGFRGWCLFALAVLFAIPAIQRSGAHPWVAGALFALPLCLFVLADRLPLRLALPGAAVVLAAVGGGMLVAPALDGDGPVVDVQQIASALQPDEPDRFDWTHGYGPLDWPRDGRILLRVKAQRPAYWKADDLEFFDGVRWRSEPGANPLTPIAEGAPEHPRWRQDVRVTVAGMQTRQFIAPGETLSISRAPARPVNTRAGGFTVAMNHDDLSTGDAYLAESYVPRPSDQQLRAAPADYPGYLGDETTIFAPPDGSNGRILIHFQPFGTGLAPIATGPGTGEDEAVAVLQRTGYGAVYALSRRLASESSTPYEYVQRVEDYLNGSQFVYEENVRDSRLPLADFLLRTHAGYCQHYSGAMALLLRMGGVPARVSAGFTPGQLDSKSGEYVVRDLDAHSWVEVWFVHLGWVTFDPTPADAPARSQESGGAAADIGGVPRGPEPRGGIGADLGPGGGTPTDLGSGSGGTDPAPFIAVGIAAVLLAGGGGWLVARRRRRAQLAGPPFEIAELERALRRTGRTIAPGTTLLALEQRFRGSPGARAYVRALGDRRYAARADGPTREQRRALRRALAAGMGPLARLRALWALPPRGLH
ncbi:transglutaminase family protein [Capillimicrobium parvum]|uniref:transglutaminase family protein n=1 Tax=Capillimicrobium parvum TaxID=2884022 RepID=UPI00216B2C03|nr:transglutaminase domain-containing protein [Capillimicrobium parvum]